MKNFEVVDSQNRVVGTVQANSYSDAFYEVDKKYGERTAISSKLRLIDCSCQSGWICPSCADKMRSERQEMIDALIEAQNAMDNWVRIYASDQCDQESVDNAKAEIYNRGGTLAYIADVNKGIIEALKKAGCTE